MIDMWEKIFTEDVLKEIIKILGGDNATEDVETLKDAVEHFSAYFDYSVFVDDVDAWAEMTTLEQTVHSILRVGEEYASRFMIIMDYLVILKNKEEQSR